MIYSIDFETRSTAELPDVGLDNYANDPSTEVLCIAFGTIPKMCKYLSQWIDDYAMKALMLHVANGGKIQAWNAMFEYAIWNCVCVPKYGWPVLKLEQCIDTMAVAAANNIRTVIGRRRRLYGRPVPERPYWQEAYSEALQANTKASFNNDPELMQPAL